ncbi:hypothetical protein HZF24_06930 [Sedimentibacter hydroxybenzoicus DSM 7310]|uniref:Uncharacterized protein n=1 Tax=Sedimentibacter hydroxybenzoicus DSM 7310 TaxID=1123245 RepID=A0A974BIR9_SEDHY|nr:hypothetical protein [Sedimentibacter hydroxybenzoicus]NYB73872.1 hypothetical protein [Sedimentibacter hydroxybenzoicus DSM 7310]
MYGNIDDWNKTKNKLTLDLLEQGYTKDNHPEYVKWHSGMHEFEYTSKFLYDSVWEAPCGVMRKGCFTSGYMCYAGIQWRVENNNYNFHCPYRKKECELRHPLLKDKINVGGQCSWHLSDKPYDYDNSAEKIKDERQKLTLENLNKKFGTNGMISCTCCHINEDTCEPYFKYEPYNCINFTKNGCWNGTCWCTGKERDLTLANIYYDVKTTTEYRKGFIVEPVIQIVKGKKLFDSRKAMTDLEMYLKLYPDAVYEKERMRHHIQLHRAKYCDEKFELEVLNIRVEKRESRDLMQDLEDIRDGIEVVHESDKVKKNKADKRNRREKYQKDKQKRIKKEQLKRLEKKIRTGMYKDLDGNIVPLTSELLEHAKEKLKENGIEIREQIGINDLLGDD